MLWSAQQILLKLARMPPREILYRASETLRTAGERLWLYHRWGPFRSGRHAGAVAATLLENVTTLLPGARAADLDRLEREFPGLYRTMRDTASQRSEKFLSRRWPLFEFPWSPEDRIEWQRDPRTGYRWPSAFHAAVALYELPAGVDVKYVWELNRHHFLVELSRAWALAKEERYAAAARQILIDWIGANPVLVGVNWASTLEVAVRSIAWLWTLAALSRWGGWKKVELESIAHCLCDHAEYLHRHLSIYSSPYNHLIGEATALYLLGHVLGPAAGAARWRKRATEVLDERARVQFYEDGFSLEQATGYHHYTIGFLLMVDVASQRFACPLPSLRSILRNSLAAGLAFQRPDGTWPPIGDLDSARSIPVASEHYWNFESIYALAEVVLGEPLLRNRVQSEEAYWLWGTEGLASPAGREGRQAVEYGYLPESGYASGRDDSSGDWLLLDAGPLAHGVSRGGVPRAMHGHADHLQVLLMIDGSDVLVDPGISSYASPSAWQSRLPESHSTITVEGVSVAKQVARLAWAYECGRPELHARLAPRVWLMRGVLRLDGGVLVQRNILGLPGLGYWIVDLARTPEPRRVSWHWQLAPCLSPLRHEQDENGLRASLPGLVWVSKSSCRLRTMMARPGATERWTERAVGYGQVRQGCQLAFVTDSTREVALLTFIGRAPAPCRVSIEGIELACGDIGRLGPTSLASKCMLSWQVHDGTRRCSFLADPSGDFDRAGYTSIAGRGDWDVLGKEELTPTATR